MSCPFCSLFESGITGREILAENEAAVAWLHESMAHRGHSVIVARRHAQNLSELDATESERFLDLARRVESAILEETASERAILMKLGLQVPHLHLHIYPFRGDATREQVMMVIDGKVTDESTADDKHDFADRVRARLQTGENS